MEDGLGTADINDRVFRADLKGQFESKEEGDGEAQHVVRPFLLALHTFSRSSRPGMTLVSLVLIVQGDRRLMEDDIQSILDSSGSDEPINPSRRTTSRRGDSQHIC